MPRSKLWAIVLAGGDGTRLASLTRALHRAEIPKQFAMLDGLRTLLQATLDRIADLADRAHTVVVIRRGHEDLARQQLRGYPGVHLLVQPRNLDTGPAITIALAYIGRLDARARVAVFPSDHHIGRPAPFLDAVERASRTARHVTLMGVVGTHAEQEYGWIVPGKAMPREARAVVRFVEKPAAPLAAQLLAEGALWNTFVAAGPLAAWDTLTRRHLAIHRARIDGAASERDLEDVYRELPPASFSRDVFGRARNLAVVAVDNVEWTDLGTPSRVYQAFTGSPALARLLAARGDAVSDDARAGATA